jgi:hypothetical protein
VSYFKRLYTAGMRMRRTAVVDDDFPEMMHNFDSALHAIEEKPVMPKIICLCGSTRFYDAFQKANYELTMAGNIVLSVGFYPHTPEVHGEGVGATDAQKVALDELHKRKIDLADEIFVLNVDHYIGSSTRSEIDYARSTGKPVKYLEE